MLQELGSRRRNGSVLVGFAADVGEGGLERAREKRDRKGADLIVYNDVGRTDIGFDAVENEVVVISADGERLIPKAVRMNRLLVSALSEREQSELLRMLNRVVDADERLRNESSLDWQIPSPASGGG